MLALKKLKPLVTDAHAKSDAILDGVAALVLVAGYALLVRVVLVEAQRGLGADRPVVAGVPRARMVPATTDARQRLVAHPDVPVEHRLCVGQVLGARLQPGLGFAGLLGVQALSLGHGEHGSAFRSADLVRHVARLEAVAAALDGALAGARGLEGDSAGDGGADHATIPSHLGEK